MSAPRNICDEIILLGATLDEASDVGPLFCDDLLHPCLDVLQVVRTRYKLNLEHNEVIAIGASSDCVSAAVRLSYRQCLQIGKLIGKKALRKELEPTVSQRLERDGADRRHDDRDQFCRESRREAQAFGLTREPVSLECE